MTQSSIEYLNGQIASRDYASSGEIVTSVTMVFNNGYSITGTSTRDINAFNEAEAQQAADKDALSKLEMGVDFLLTKAA